MTPQEIANNIVWSLIMREQNRQAFRRQFAFDGETTPNIRVKATQMLRDACGISYSYMHTKTAQQTPHFDLREAVAMVDAAIAAYGKGELD